MQTCENCQQDFPDDDPMIVVDGMQTFCSVGCLSEFINNGGMDGGGRTHDEYVACVRGFAERINRIAAAQGLERNMAEPTFREITVTQKVVDAREKWTCTVTGDDIPDVITVEWLRAHPDQMEYQVLRTAISTKYEIEKVEEGS